MRLRRPHSGLTAGLWLPLEPCQRFQGFSSIFIVRQIIIPSIGEVLDAQIFCRTLAVMKRERGRPRKPADQRRTERIEVRSDAVEKSSLEKAAERAGMKLSDWIRDRLRTAASKELGQKQRTH